MTHKRLRAVTAFFAVGLLLQGTSTLLFRLVPALDRAFPALLATTMMIVPHSILHIASGLLALYVLKFGGPAAPFWFLLGFGAFYTALAILGATTGGQFGLGLQPFDHGIHIVLGVVGLGSALLSLRS